MFQTTNMSKLWMRQVIQLYWLGLFDDWFIWFQIWFRCFVDYIISNKSYLLIPSCRYDMISNRRVLTTNVLHQSQLSLESGLSGQEWTSWPPVFMYNNPAKQGFGWLVSTKHWHFHCISKGLYQFDGEKWKPNPIFLAAHLRTKFSWQNRQGNKHGHLK